MITTIETFRESMGYNMMSFEIPTEDKWITTENDETPYSIEHMGNEYYITKELVEKIKNNIGKMMSFKYLLKNRIILLPIFKDLF